MLPSVYTAEHLDALRGEFDARWQEVEAAIARTERQESDVYLTALHPKRYSTQVRRAGAWCASGPELLTTVRRSQAHWDSGPRGVWNSFVQHAQGAAKFLKTFLRVSRS